MLGITAVKIVHRQDVPESAHTIAQIAGTEKVWEETRQIGGGLFGGYGTSRGTRRRVERFIVHPNEIKTLRTGAGGRDLEAHRRPADGPCGSSRRAEPAARMI